MRFDFWQWIFLTKKQCSFYWRNRQGKSCSRTPALILTSFTVKSYIWNTIFEQSSTRLFWYKNSESNCTLVLPQTYLYSILQTRLKIYLVRSIVTNSTNFPKNWHFSQMHDLHFYLKSSIFHLTKKAKVVNTDWTAL